MPPCKDPLAVDSDSNTSNPVQDLASVINEMLRMKQQNNPDPFQLDTRIQLPNFARKTNGEMVDSWIHSLSTYFNTCLGLIEERKLQIVALQLEGLAQTWWDTEQEKTTFVIEIRDAPESSTSQPIKTWARLFKALINRFYPPGYVKSLWIKWYQLPQLPSQRVQGYIDFFCKMHLLLHVPDSEEVLILKFVVGLLIQFCQEVELFENPTLDKTF
jgi:hypothetical protein